ncbi:NUDIX domain-containing protein [Williamsia sp.]|uniref:NUDIX hydrolase n=1 Tax=Williamsia sp. TaxID=1872085 RepID=UPI002F91E10F
MSTSAEPTPKHLTVSAVCFHNAASQVLTVRKSGTAAFMLPGGKLEPGESPAQAAVREVLEEIGIKITPRDLTELGTFTAAAANEPDTSVRGHIFCAELTGTPEPAGEIAELRWYDRSDRSQQLAPLLRDHIFPALEAENIHMED